ncbi:MAG: hypothetical protein K1X67_23600 [Fimbriimonadaceae bacterium]|nr:hypothetical protein [Fimbriimonadaceae bacterium]
MDSESPATAATAFDIARIGARLAAVLLIGRFIAAFPMVPMQLEILRAEGPGTPFLSKSGAIAGLVTLVLLAATMVFLWTCADRVAGCLVGGIRAGDDVEHDERSLADALAAAAGWIMILFSLDGLAFGITRLLSEEAAPRLLDQAGSFVAFLLGLALVIARGRLTRLFGSRLPPGY